MATALVLLIAIAVRAWILSVTGNGIDFHFNAYDRPIFTWFDWMQSDRWVPLINYGPLHFYLLRAMFTVFGYDPTFAPRLLSLLFGVAALWPLMRIARRNFGDQAALAAGIGGAFYPLAVRLSSVSLEVTLFNFLALCAVDALEKGVGKNGKTTKYVAFAALWLNLACATRFEGWLLIPILTLLFLRASFWRAFAFGAIASFFPLLWMGVSYKVVGSPVLFASVAATVQRIHSQAVPLIDRMLGWPKIHLATITVFVVLVTVVGLLAALQKRKGLAPAAVGLGLFALFELFAIRGSMAFNETKYLATVGLALMPFFGFGAVWLSQKLPLRISTVGFWAILLAAAAFSTATIRADNERFAPPADAVQLCDFLEKSDPEKGRVLLGVRFQGYILVKSGLPYDRFALVPGDDNTGRRSEEDFWRIIEQESPCLLIHNTLPDRLDFQDLVAIDGKATRNQTLRGYDFNVVFQRGFWMVLSVEKNSATPPDAKE
jgi:hypothetical protein